MAATKGNEVNISQVENGLGQSQSNACHVTHFEQAIGQNRLLMRLFGIYHHRTDPLYLKAYPFTILLVFWFNFVRFSSVYEIFYGGQFQFSSELGYQIIHHLWLLTCALCSSIIFINQEFCGRLPRLYRLLSHLFADNRRRSAGDLKRLNWTINAVMGIALCIGLANSFAIVLSLLGFESFYSAFSLYLTPFHKTDWARQSLAFKVPILIVMLFTSTHWLLAIKQMLVDCLIVEFFYKCFNKEFENFTRLSVVTTDDDDELGTNIEAEFDDVVLHCNQTRVKTLASEQTFEKLRTWHLKISFCVSLLDNCYSLMLAIVISCYTFIVLMIIYILTDPSYKCIDPILKVMFPIWLCTGLLVMIAAIFFPACITSQAHAPLQHVFNLPLRRYTTSLCFKVSMMVDFLKGDRIGLTCLDFFVISREILISIAGTVLTYVIVLVQFRDQSPRSNAC
nr:G protein-coupled receptor [Proales similis]